MRSRVGCGAMGQDPDAPTPGPACGQGIRSKLCHCGSVTPDGRVTVLITLERGQCHLPQSGHGTKLAELWVALHTAWCAVSSL